MRKKWVGTLAAAAAVGLFIVLVWNRVPLLHSSVDRFSGAIATNEASKDQQCQDCTKSDRRSNVGMSLSQLAELMGQTVDRQQLQRSCSESLPEAFSLKDIVGVAARADVVTKESDLTGGEHPPHSIPCLAVDEAGSYVLAATSADGHDVFVWAPDGAVTRLAFSQCRLRFGSRVLHLKDSRSSVPPSLVINSHYAGKPVQGEVGEYRHFTLFNSGAAAVDVVDVSSTCSCARATLSPLIVPPRGAATLRIEALTAADEGVDFVSWPVVIRTRQSQQSEFAFNLKAHVDRQIIVAPRVFHFDGLAEGFATQTLQITARSDDRRDRAQLAPAYLDYGLRWGGSKSSENVSTAVLYLDSSPLNTSPDRTFALQAVLYDRGRPEHRWQVLVNGSLRRSLEFLPSELFVGNVAPRQRIHRQVRLKNESATEPAFELPQPERLSARVDGDTVHVELVAPDEAGSFRYNLLAHVNGCPANLPVSGIVTSEAP